jgi:hypothetical protein
MIVASFLAGIRVGDILDKFYIIAKNPGQRPYIIFEFDMRFANMANSRDSLMVGIRDRVSTFIDQSVVRCAQHYGQWDNVGSPTRIPLSTTTILPIFPVLKNSPNA